jgi:hypothetical protein
MLECDCKDWKENIGIINSALILASSHGYKGLQKSFKFCPYCNKKLKERKKGN